MFEDERKIVRNSRQLDETLPLRKLTLKTAIDRLLPVETAFLFERYHCFRHHQMGDHATRPLARLLSPLALLLLLAWNGHAALSRLASRLSNRTLEHVQSPFLG